ncbi:MAG: AsmA family protein [Planctomycetes bacterium]|nr:AsmA family protein [Planctomycetota bacterium]
MKKLLRIAVVLLLILVVVIGVVIFMLDGIAKSRIESATTTMLGVKTTVGSLNIKLISAQGRIGNLNIANPDGYKADHFMTLKKGELGVSLSSLLGDTVEVPKIELDGIDVMLEKQGGKANYEAILANMKKGETQPDPADPQKTGKKFMVREIVIRNLMVHVDMMPLVGNVTKLDVPIEEIHMTNVGSDSDNGVQMKELSGTIVKAVFTAIAAKGGGILPAELTTDLLGGLSHLKGVGDIGVKFTGEATKQLTNITGALGKGVGDVVGKDAGKALEGLGGIFNKKKTDEKK